MISENIEKMKQMMEGGMTPEFVPQQEYQAAPRTRKSGWEAQPQPEYNSLAHSLGQDATTSCTLLVTGFPQNTNDREIENFCRFMPGFVGAKSSFKTFPQVFIKFDTHENVQNAVFCLDQQPFDLHDANVLLKAHVARTELLNPQLGMQLQSRSGIGPMTSLGALDQILGMADGSAGDPNSAMAAMGGGAMGDEPAWKKARVGEDEADTLVVMNLQDKNLDENTLRSVFEVFTGFMHLAVMPGRLGGKNCFIKFHSPMHAQAAKVGAPPNFSAETARRSLNLPGQSPPGHGAAGLATMQAQAQGGGGGLHGPGSLPMGTFPGIPGKGEKGKGGSKYDSRTPIPDNEKDTVVVMNIIEKGYSQELMMEFWPALTGFGALRISEPTAKGGRHCFVKFIAPEFARGALEIALAQGFDASMSRNNMDPTQATLRAPGFGQ